MTTSLTPIPAVRSVEEIIKLMLDKSLCHGVYANILRGIPFSLEELKPKIKDDLIIPRIASIVDDLKGVFDVSPNVMVWGSMSLILQELEDSKFQQEIIPLNESGSEKNNRLSNDKNKENLKGNLSKILDLLEELTAKIAIPQKLKKFLKPLMAMEPDVHLQIYSEISRSFADILIFLTKNPTMEEANWEPIEEKCRSAALRLQDRFRWQIMLLAMADMSERLEKLTTTS